MNLGSILGNIVSSGASKLVESVGNAFDQNFTNKEEKEAAKLELLKAINEHTQKMAESQIKEIEIYLKDADSARNREIQIATSDKAPLINKIIQPLLALLVLGSCFLFWYIMLFKDIDKDKETLMAGITGSLTTLAMGIIGYYFGSSTGSKQKADQLDKLMNK